MKALQVLPKSQLYSALLCWILIQGLGLLLRLQFVKPIAGLNYGFFLHAHSHVALLGWVHAILLITLPRAFLAPDLSLRPYHRLFWFSQLTVLGMLLSFPFQGYAAISITFSTLSLFGVYALAWLLLKDTRGDASLSRYLLRASLLLLVLSTVGPWSLGPILALKLNHSPIYYLAIYFYLHFQYNAWFLLACLALGLRWLETQGLPCLPPWQRAARWLVWSTLPTFALSALWLNPPLWVWGLAGVGALMQLWSLFQSWQAIRLPAFQAFCLSRLPQAGFQSWPVWLLWLSGGCLQLKLGLQALTALPYFAQLAAQQRPLIIFYLHLVLLGGISCFLLAYLLPQFLSATAKGPSQCLQRWGLHLGLGLFVTGFGLSEALLLYQGLAMGWGWVPFGGFFLWLLLSSALMPLGLLVWLSLTAVAACWQPKTGSAQP